MSNHGIPPKLPSVHTHQCSASIPSWRVSSAIMTLLMKWDMLWTSGWCSLMLISGWSCQWCSNKVNIFLDPPWRQGLASIFGACFYVYQGHRLKIISISTAFSHSCNVLLVRHGKPQHSTVTGDHTAGWSGSLLKAHETYLKSHHWEKTTHWTLSLLITSSSIVHGIRECSVMCWFN